MPQLADLPLPLRRRPFAVGEALSLGVTRGRLRSGDLVAPFTGVRASAGADSTLRGRCLSYRVRMHPDHFFSHLTAARLFGAPLPADLTLGELDVCARSPGRAPEARGVRGRQLSLRPGDLRESGGIRHTSAALTWCSLAGELALEDLVAVADHLVTPIDRDTAPIATIEDLALCVEARPGMRGRRLLLKALPLIRVGPRSRPESLSRVVLVRAGIPEPELNLEVRDSAGRFLAIPDLCWPDLRVALEYEGEYHRTERGQFHRDINRIERLVDAGWVVIRVSAAALFDETPELVARVARRLRTAGWPGVVDLRTVARLSR